jgi:hypothetical protein
MMKIRFLLNSYHLRSRKLEEEKSGAVGWNGSQCCQIISKWVGREEREQFLCQVFTADVEIAAG